jgi:hypothetical protein
MSSNYETTQHIIRYPYVLQRSPCETWLQLLILSSAAISFLFFTILVLLLDVMQIILWTRDRLHPAHFAGLTMFQTAFWGLVLLMDIISIVQNRQNPRAVGLVVIIL